MKQTSCFYKIACALGAVVASFSVERAAMADEPYAPLPDATPAPFSVAPEAATAPPAASPILPAPQAQPSPAPARNPSPGPAPAATSPSTDHGADADRAENVVMQPWDVDVRAALHTTPILQYGGVGASADAGMRRIGPGTFAMGGGFDYFFCGTTCSSSPLSFTQKQLSFEGRVSYHLAPPKMSNVDFYPLVTAGFIVSRSSLTVGDNSEYRASDVAPSVGFGAGASYFFGDRFFAAAEARFRYAAGTYSYELASGPEKPFDKSGVDTWSMSTVDLAVAFGARF
jgi:hypothetical protein